MSSLFIDSVREVIFPSECRSCTAPLSSHNGTQLCSPCGDSLEVNLGQRCSGCDHPLSLKRCAACKQYGVPWNKIRAPFLYGGKTQELILAYKTAGNYNLANLLADLMLQDSEVRTILDSATLLSFVPLHPRKRFKRGYNQSRELAKAISRKMGIPLRPTLRHLGTHKGQQELPKNERLRLKPSVFQPTGLLLEENLVLVDDVITTGTTLRAATMKIQRKQNVSILCLAFARSCFDL